MIDIKKGKFTFRLIFLITFHRKLFLQDASVKKMNSLNKYLTDTCPDQTLSNVSNYYHEKSEIPDSLALQFENKIEDCFIVPETPPENVSPVKTPQKDIHSRLLDSSSTLNSQTQADDFDLLKDCIQIDSQKRLSPEENVKHVKKKLEYNSKLDVKSQEVFPISKRLKATEDVDMSSKEDIFERKTTNSSVFLKSKTKKEAKVQDENMSICVKNKLSSLTKLDLNVVYTKKKPPAHSIKIEVILQYV